MAKKRATDRKIKDSGKRREFKTGAVRDINENKGRFDLLPMLALKDLAIHFQKGCQKYGDRNWEKGIPISNLVDSGLRHAVEFVLGYEDEDHLIAAIWNLINAREILLRIDAGILPEELDDLPYIMRGKDDESKAD